MEDSQKSLPLVFKNDKKEPSTPPTEAPVNPFLKVETRDRSRISRPTRPPGR
jgi:hypothetical protein